MGSRLGSSKEVYYSWVVIHMCMETTQGISLCNYLYLKLAKYVMFFLLSFMFFLLRNRRTGGQTTF
jgi:hypothetical protein